MDQRLSFIEETPKIIGTELEDEKEHGPPDKLLHTEHNKTANPSVRDVLPQIIASCIAHCTMIQAGINIGYSPILADGLKKEGVSDEEISWIASLVTITLPVGALISGPLMDRYGRKKVCLGSCLPGLVSWSIMMKGRSVYEIGLARMIAGFSAGLSTSSLVYISEITHPWIRSMLLCFHSGFASLGILIATCLGRWQTWDEMSFIFFAISIGVLFMLLFLPESPHWIMCFSNDEMDDRKNRVQSALKKLNKSERIYQEELCRIYEISENFGTKTQSNNSIAEKTSLLLSQFRIPSVYKPTLILLGLFIFQQLSGTYVVIFYVLSMFHEIGGRLGENSRFNALLFLGVSRFIASLVTALISKKFGRRVLGISSGLGMTFSMLYLVLYIYFKSKSDTSDLIRMIFDNQKEWIPMFVVVFYVLASSLGFAIVPWTLIGELLPTSVRGSMAGIMISYAHILMFGMVKGYHYMVKKMSVQGIFCFYGTVSLMGCVYVYLFVPETLGKSLIEIERYFNGTEIKNHSSSDKKRRKTTAEPI